MKQIAPHFLEISLGLLLALLANSCLIADPPDLQDPKQTRPSVHLLHVHPTLAEPINVAVPDSGDPEPSKIDFSIPFYSEDLGEEVGVQLHLYGKSGYIDNVMGTRVDGADLATPRVATLSWPLNRRPFGCYRVDAIIAHESSFNSKITDGFVKEERQNASEILSWLVNFHRKQEDTTMLNECPRVGLH